jgi:hypothetical protein
LKRLAPATLLLGLAACGPPAVEQSDWEQKHLAQAWAEEEVQPPSYPANADLAEFDVPGTPGFRFFIDRSSLAVGSDDVVRYVAVARSGEGAENVSFEGLRCATHEYRIYAVGHPEHRWSGRPGAWQPVAAGAARWRAVLERDYFCRGKQPIRNREEGLRLLRQGGWNPDS